MPLKIRNLHRALTRKLKADVEHGSNHDLYDVLDDSGHTVATTALSRSYREVSDDIAGEIAKDLGVSNRFLRDLVRCPGTREQYLEIVMSLH